MSEETDKTIQERVKEAYEKTGIIPRKGTFARLINGKLYCCGITALLCASLDISIEKVEEKLKFINTVYSSTNIFHYIASTVGLTPKYVQYFIAGFDNNTNSFFSRIDDESDVTSLQAFKDGHETRELLGIE